MSINDEKTGQEQRKWEGIAVTPLMSICHYAVYEQQKWSETPRSNCSICDDGEACNEDHGKGHDCRQEFHSFFVVHILHSNICYKSTKMYIIE